MGAGAGSRRDVLRGIGLVGAGAAVGVAGLGEAADVRERKLPIFGGPAAATVANGRQHPGHGSIEITWAVETDQKLIALTFDDGPSPQWTNQVLDTLAERQVSATFFMIGRRVRKYAGVIRGRMDTHEVGNHTWDHIDLARRGPDEAYQDLISCHRAIEDVVGRSPTLMRPPYGHMAGSTALAAARMNYRVVLWSLQMLEGDYPNNSPGLARYIVENTIPGTILLAHDVGPANRIIAIDGLPAMIDGLRERGYEFVTISGLVARTAAHPAS
jgi:peptidoglycan/xylan/chitin deacetylase (PgdA/CDA1 family)